jgi:hypothetical protein
MLGARDIPYYIVTDTATGKGVEGYGCETWARHRANKLNRKEKDEIRTAVQREQK